MLRTYIHCGEGSGLSENIRNGVTSSFFLLFCSKRCVLFSGAGKFWVHWILSLPAYVLKSPPKLSHIMYFFEAMNTWMSFSGSIQTVAADGCLASPKVRDIHACIYKHNEHSFNKYKPSYTDTPNTTCHFLQNKFLYMPRQNVYTDTDRRFKKYCQGRTS